jgi:hypothetical protein
MLFLSCQDISHPAHLFPSNPNPICPSLLFNPQTSHFPRPLSQLHPSPSPFSLTIISETQSHKLCRLSHVYSPPPHPFPKPVSAIQTQISNTIPHFPLSLSPIPLSFLNLSRKPIIDTPCHFPIVNSIFYSIPQRLRSQCLALLGLTAMTNHFSRQALLILVSLPNRRGF